MEPLGFLLDLVRAYEEIELMKERENGLPQGFAPRYDRERSLTDAESEVDSASGTTQRRA